MKWSRAACLCCLLALAACDPEVWSTEVGLELLFPSDQSPLDDVEALRLRVVVEEEQESGALERVDVDTFVIERPSSGSWSSLSSDIELGLVDLELAQVVIEGVDLHGEVLSAGESLPIPLQSGKTGHIALFFQRVGTSGLGPPLARSFSQQGATYL
jgi:hypothetical protein